MSARARLGIAAGGVLGALGVALALALGGTRGGAAESPLRARLAGPAMPPNFSAGRFALRDEDGHVVRFADLRGRVAVLTFLYTHCRDTCPLMAQQIRGALDQLGRDVPALAVSVDPAGDTQASAVRFLVRQRMLGRMRFLLGSRAQLAPVWRHYGIRPQTKDEEHIAFVFVIDPRSRVRVGYPASQLTPEDLAHDIRLLAARA